MSEYLGFACAFLIGTVLGLTGAGGAILTVPVLVYIIGLNPVLATAYSLFIVGTTSVFGTAINLKKNLVNVKTALIFAVPSLVGVYLARKVLLPSIPETLLTIGQTPIEKGTVLMVLFAVIMVFAAFSMLSDRRERVEKPANANKWFLMIKLFFAGIVVGLVGAGGGFLFVPILMYVANLQIKKAAATSLLIVAINSLIGFSGDLQQTPMDWHFLLLFTSFAIAGIIAGIYLVRFTNERLLKKGFGWFVLLMAAVILTTELLF